MVKYAFISRHKPTAEQLQLAATQGIELIHIGDTNAFSVTPEFVNSKGYHFVGVIVVHPSAALRLCKHFRIGIFENEFRTPASQPQQFAAKALHLYDLYKAKPITPRGE